MTFDPSVDTMSPEQLALVVDVAEKHQILEVGESSIDLLIIQSNISLQCRCTTDSLSLPVFLLESWPVGKLCSWILY